MTNIVEDISTLSNVSEKTLEKFIDIGDCCICHSILEEIQNKNDIVQIDIGIGELTIKIECSQIKYKFVPSKKLEKMIVTTVTTNESPIVSNIDKNLQEKIDRTYKELL